MIPLDPDDPHRSRKELLARSWDESARGYERYFVPRFEPWTAEALDALAKAAKKLPPGPVVVPCCGPGQELLPLSLAFPDREIVGIDLSPTMVALARARIGGATGVWAEEGDASALAARFPGTAAAVFSCFGLQQLPEPDRALEDWGRCVAPRGALAVLFWPPESRDGAAFDLIFRLVQERAPRPEATWEARLRPALERAGLEVIAERDAVHSMEHESAEAFFDALAGAGPLRALALAKGVRFMGELKSAFVAGSPGGRLVHSPRARFLLAKRPAG